MQKRGIILLVALVLLVGFFIGYKYQVYKNEKEYNDFIAENSGQSEGWQLVENEEYGKAIKEFDNYLKKNERNYFAHSGLGWSYYYKSDFNNAIKHFEIAKSLEPLRSSPYHGLGVTYLKQRKYENSIQEYSRALSLGTLEALKIFTGLGFAYYYNKNYSNAVLSFNNAILEDNNYLIPYIGLMLANYEIGDIETASNHVKVVLSFQVTESLKKDTNYIAYSRCMENEIKNLQSIYKCGQVIYR